MSLQKFNVLELPAAADFHVHLRDGAMMETVVPTIRQGGVNVVYVMPNLVPPITTVQQALDYRSRLQALEPKVHFLMSLYLHPSISPDTVREAKEAGITGIKSYPAGVTTNSSSGVVDYASFYPVFAEMERQDIVLNLHGEVPSSADNADVTVLNAEERFLPTLGKLHHDFPKLRIVLEHCTSAKAIDAVLQCGPSVSATITAHHLHLIVDDVVGNAHHFCKPVAKLPSDRTALLKAAASGNAKFFFGSDSAPHPARSKIAGQQKPAAGVFTQPYATQTVLDAFEMACEKGMLREDDITRDLLSGFLSRFGRAFYRVPDENKERIVLRSGDGKIDDMIRGTTEDQVDIVPFRSGSTTWALEWKT
ncbi:MAG: hypothetical protein M1817_005225 [Caeruleum heppii]|nr:MAG: hypothetical protein M1817_005225 [Caeruleum heppii]